MNDLNLNFNLKQKSKIIILSDCQIEKIYTYIFHLKNKFYAFQKIFYLNILILSILL